MNLEFLDKFSEMLSEISENDLEISNKRGQLDVWKNNLYEFLRLYYILDDINSKEIFFKIVKLYMAQALSGNKICKKYSLYSELDWKNYVEKAKIMTPYVKNDYLLDRIEVYILEGYSYNNICKVQEGDYVIDCGAYTGNTSVYFSQKVGEKGKVFSFEAMPETYSILCENIEKYNNILPFNFALTNKSSEIKFSSIATPGAKIIDDIDSDFVSIKGISIDEFVQLNKINKIDFIKMDIEGAELDALDGCKKTCAKFLPKLAISIYHKKDDWISIPKKILEINPNYRFYIKHNSNNFIETVLFAINCNDTLKNKIVVDHNEVNYVKKLWKLYDNIYLNKQKRIKQLLLENYINIFKTVSKLKFEFHFEDKNFNYVLIPISDDRLIHYEVSFSGEKLSISLHLEGKWKDEFKIFDKFNNIYLNNKLVIRGNKSKCEYGFSINEIYEYEKVAKLLNILVENTFYTLLESNMVSDKLIIENYNIFSKMK